VATVPVAKMVCANVMTTGVWDFLTTLATAQIGFAHMTSPGLTLLMFLGGSINTPSAQVKGYVHATQDFANAFQAMKAEPVSVKPALTVAPVTADVTTFKI